MKFPNDRITWIMLWNGANDQANGLYDKSKPHEFDSNGKI